jgi:hypothetical protein
MSPDELLACGRALYGDRWQTSLAQDLAVAGRTMRRWVAGESPIPDSVESKLRGVLETRLNVIGGIIGYSVKLADRSIFHHGTCASFRIEDDDDTVTLLFDKLIPPGQHALVIAGAKEALRRERERDPRVVGQFVWR